jgi:hypothetical protein
LSRELKVNVKDHYDMHGYLPSPSTRAQWRPPPPSSSLSSCSLQRLQRYVVLLTSRSAHVAEREADATQLLRVGPPLVQQCRANV